MRNLVKQGNSVTGKSEDLYEHLIYGLATGRWKAGEKLPSVRKAEETWAVNRLTVLSVYQRLEASNLIESKGRRGFFVLPGANFDDLSRHHFELESIYKKVMALLREETSLLPTAVLKSLVALSDFKAHENPEVAFVECSHYQAHCHALEIEQRLRIPVAPLSLEALDKDKPAVLDSIRCLITTGFHFEEVLLIAKKLNLPAYRVVIAVDEQNLLQHTMGNSAATLFEYELSMGKSIKEDILAVTPEMAIDICIDKPSLDALRKYLFDCRADKIMLPPRVFGSADSDIRVNEKVLPVDYRIVEDQWKELAQKLKLSISWYMNL